MTRVVLSGTKYALRAYHHGEVIASAQKSSYLSSQLTIIAAPSHRAFFKNVEGKKEGNKKGIFASTFRNQKAYVAAHDEIQPADRRHATTTELRFAHAHATKSLDLMYLFLR